MADVIMKRTVFYTKDKNGVIQFCDWAIVQTPLGCMAEPFNVNARPTTANLLDETGLDGWDYDADESRIDDLVLINRAQRNMLLSAYSGDIALHGGDTALL